MFRRFYQISLLAIIIFSLGCTSSRMADSKVNEESFPAEFGKAEQILLIQKRPAQYKAINNYIEKSFRKNYSGKFEMATAEDIKSNSKYQDTRVYRYLLVESAYTHGEKVVSSSGIQYNYAYSMDFHLVDRQQNQGYPSLGVSSNVPAKAINRTSVLLNERLKKS